MSLRMSELGYSKQSFIKTRDVGNGFMVYFLLVGRTSAMGKDAVGQKIGKILPTLHQSLQKYLKIVSMRISKLPKHPVDK